MKNISRYRPSAAAIPLLVAACGSGSSPIIEMHFGTTKWAWDRPGAASDYIEDFHTKIPEAAARCQATLLGLNGGITDGGEAAYFLPRHTNDAEACLKRAFPQGHFELIERREWDTMIRNNAEFPLPLRLIPKQAETPPPPTD